MLFRVPGVKESVERSEDDGQRDQGEDNNEKSPLTVNGHRVHETGNDAKDRLFRAFDTAGEVL